MKKKILIILGIWIVISLLFGVAYKIFNTKHQPDLILKPITSDTLPAKEPFRTIGLAAAETTLERGKPIIKPFAKKMVEFGATDVALKIEKNSSMITKNLPPIIIAGKKYKNKKICAIVMYTYKNKKYEIGSCR